MYVIRLIIKGKKNYWCGLAKHLSRIDNSWDTDINFAKVFRNNKKEKVLAKKELSILKSTVGSEKAKIIFLKDCPSKNFYINLSHLN